MYCPKCKNMISESLTICPYCGTPLNNLNNEPNTINENQQSTSSEQFSQNISNQPTVQNKTNDILDNQVSMTNQSNNLNNLNDSHTKIDTNLNMNNTSNNVNNNSYNTNANSNSNYYNTNMNPNNNVYNTNINSNNNANNVSNNFSTPMVNNQKSMGNNQNNSFSNQPSNVNSPNKPLQTSSFTKKLIIILLLVIIIILLVITTFIILKGDKNKTSPRPNDDSRTIMLYIVGSDLESENAIVTSDLDAILPDKINLDKTNILLYTGGTEKWHNFIQNDENAIYILKEDGFEKLESYETKNMGDYEVFKSFLDYTYDNYKTEKYNLIMYNHGGALDGAMYDDFTNDNLSLEEMSKALKESPFSESNKFDSVTFRTCLNGTIEVANVFAKYADYMIASEEITFGSGFSNVLSFLNNIEEDDDGMAFGKKFIESYKRQMNELDPHESVVSTYSIIDLSKIDEIEQALDDFIADIDLEENYRTIARVRSNLYQYAYQSSDIKAYDTVDLYELIKDIKDISPQKGEKLLDTIEESIKYNWSNNEESHGLSIYFPYNGEESAKVTFLKIYSHLSFSKKYNDFINDFAKKQSNPADFAVDFKISDNDLSYNNDNNEFSLSLTDEQAANYASASYIIFQKEADNTYMPIYNNNNAILNGNTLKTNINDTIVKIVDKKTNEEAFLQVTKNNNISQNSYETTAIIHNYDDGTNPEEWQMHATKIFISLDEDNKPFITQAIPIGDDIAKGKFYDLTKYKTIEFTNYRYQILDQSGKYNENWIGTDTQYLFSVSLTDDAYELKTVPLEDGDYYCLFKVTDITNKTFYSNLIQLERK